MAAKYQQISELSKMVIPLLTKDKDDWIYFLEATANHYKYPFHNQALIYAQRPLATACAPFEFWNEKMHRWINKGAKGIALIEHGINGSYLEYVFDVADTNGRNEVSAWKYQQQYKETVSEALIDSFGETEDECDSFESFISSIVHNAALDNAADYFEQYLNTRERSEELNQFNIQANFIDAVKVSVSYMISVRLGLNTSAITDKNDFSFLDDFKGFEQVTILGTAVSDTSEMILRVIEKAVKEQARIDRLAKNSVQAQNKDKKETERSDINDNELYAEWRSTSARSDNRKFGEELDRQVRNAEKDLSEAAQKGDLFDDDTKRNTDTALKNNRRGSQSAGRDDLKSNTGNTSGAGQSERSDGLGGAYEQPAAIGGRNRNRRYDLQLSLFPSEDEQQTIIRQAEEKTSSAFLISQEEIDEMLQKGSGIADGKYRIYMYYQENHNATETINFLKHEYGIGGGTHVFSNGSYGSDWHNEKGIALSKEHIGIAESDILLNWSKVHKRIGELIEAERYLSIEEKNYLPEYLRQIEEQRRRNDEEAYVREILDSEQSIIEEVDSAARENRIKEAEQPQAESQKSFEKKDLIIEISKQERFNFHITDDDLGTGGLKTKYAWNIAAIKLLSQLKEGNRLASPEEQEILSKYVGWGGIPQAFEKKNSQWAREYSELKELLDADEYAMARASTLNAHYTSPIIIKAMYSCLENMGFKTGNILEPAMGIGNFFGLVPESMTGSKFYGVELDSVTGRIAKQLYQNASITVQGYEQTNLPDSFFDIAIGNVPFGSYGVADKKYDQYHFLIHDYFFAKTLDKVRPGGIIAFITSKGTMDKQNSEVRKYISQRAELLGAVRLPNNAFLANAGTNVTSDILFLKKRDRVIDINEDWIHLGLNEDGLPINAYFVQNPHMIIGTMTTEHTQYGREDTTCQPFENADLGELLKGALENIHTDIAEYEIEEISEDTDTSIPADPDVRNFSYTVVDGEIYYRENSRMNKADVSLTAEGRIKGMIAVRDCVRDLIYYQTEDYSDETISQEQQKLNSFYDVFTEKYGLINSRANNMAFSDDSSYCLLCSLEIIDENGELERKADMFTKRTIRQRTRITHVDTASEALGISIAEKAGVDIAFMQKLTGIPKDQIEKDLEGVIFRNPENQDSEGSPIFETADEYLSGNVREKLKNVIRFAQIHPGLYDFNVNALKTVQPTDLDASEIDVRLGATWLPPDVVKDFVFDLLETPYMYRRYIDVFYSSYTANWNVKGKNDDSDNIKANVTYGTGRINAYKIIEDTLNLRDVRIFDTVYEDGNEKRILNKKETAIAQQKQEAIKEAFQNWIYSEAERRERLCRIYNDRFNSIRPREYDGSHIRFTGMNPEITLRKHQIDAVAHILYGGNTLLAHCVGAGKTYEMTAAAMEAKHLGLCQKSLFVVPNHLTEQWAGEFLQLYPAANILVSTKKDFETKNRKKFCARIATGDYDAVIIGHSQFEKIPISQQRQRRQLEEQIDEITSGIIEIKAERGERYAIKQLEKTKKTLKLRLDKLNDQSRKDDVVTFEELGVDRLFVDEADNFKNLFLYTKMRNVAGLSQTEALKSSDLFSKCRYLDELTNGRGIIFATGTPISNSITEMYTMQRYLQYQTLRKNSLQHFDCWASTFGETITAIELAPEGTGYRAKTRFARFYNLPELMNMFKEVADIKTADMLDLPVPKENYHNIAVKPSEFQKEMVAELAQRAEQVRAGTVEPYEDNMLKITNDGRKLALDQRLMNGMLPDFEDGKVNACVDNIYHYWKENTDKRLTQLAFCDLSTPHYDGSFNVYDDIKKKLVEKGVPPDEISYIHDANTETKKKELFVKVRRGQVRILLGSTFKMGAGTNVQNRLIALHDIDCPWRPRDLEQRAGRIVRQGNMNDEVHIFRYVTENTFDAYLYQILENKQRFISQIMTSKSPLRSAEDIDETSLSYAEVKALATGNPLIKEKMDLDIQVSKLKLFKANHLIQRYALEDRLLKYYPQQIKITEQRIACYENDFPLYEKNKTLEFDGVDAEDSKFAGMTIEGIHYNEKAKAGAAILEACKQISIPELRELGNYMGFPILLGFDSFKKEYQITLRGALSHTVSLGTDIHGNITRLNNLLSEIPKKMEYCKELLKTLNQQMETAKEQVDLPFEKEEELQIKSARLAQLNILLSMDKRENEMMDGEPDDDIDSLKRCSAGYER